MPSGTIMNLCFTKLKSPLPNLLPHNDDDDDDNDQINLSRPLPNNPSSMAHMMIKNFNSIYHPETSTSIIDHGHRSTPSTTNLTSYYSSDSEPDFATAGEPDFATIYASQRFFVTSPGRSNSIIESTPSISNSSSLSDHCTTTPPDSMAVSTYSPDPYVDFRQSMQEMVEARDMHMIDAKANLDYLHELLLCYLTLNPKSTHKFIIGAFVDLLVSLRPPPADGGRS
ncbi:hypothetical protein ACFE04_031955 [Oxalis oulophora]